MDIPTAFVLHPEIFQPCHWKAVKTGRNWSFPPVPIDENKWKKWLFLELFGYFRGKVIVHSSWYDGKKIWNRKKIKRTKERERDGKNDRATLDLHSGKFSTCGFISGFFGGEAVSLIRQKPLGIYALVSKAYSLNYRWI